METYETIIFMSGVIIGLVIIKFLSYSTKTLKQRHCSRGKHEKN